MPLLSDKLRALRQLHGYSQEYVSLKSGQSQPNYSKIESGQIQPKLNTLEKVADLYQIDMADLLSKTSVQLVAQVAARPDFVTLMGGANSYINGIHTGR